MKHPIVLGVIPLALIALASCSSDTSDATASSEPAVSSTITQASATDVAFAQSMIPHHEQAVEMADAALAPQSGASPEVKELATQIKAAQAPEISQMTQWLQGWGAPTSMPGAGEDLAGMDHSGHDMGGMDVSGMMTAEQMAQMQQMSGQEFDEMWLAMMIEHHRGAIAMADQARSSNNPKVQQMAGAITSGQEKEIQTMQALLADGGR